MRNGAQTEHEMRTRIERYRRFYAGSSEDYQIGCILLQSPFFLLIANLELEFRATHRKVSPLKIPNRKFLAIFRPRKSGNYVSAAFSFQLPASSIQLPEPNRDTRSEIRATATKHMYFPISNRNKTGLLFSRISISGGISSGNVVATLPGTKNRQKFAIRNF